MRSPLFANEPQLVLGDVMHCRRRPVVHHFAYPALYCVLPLHTLKNGRQHGFGINRAMPMAFYDRDHGARDGSALMPWLKTLISRNSGPDAASEITSVWLQCFPRLLGYVFNPVSFWFACRADGEVVAILAEVNNTFGERHNYLLRHPDSRPITDGDLFERDKVFHVSPFFPVRGHYRFRFHLSDQRPTVCIDYADAQGDLLLTAVGGTPQVMSARAVMGTLLRFPFFTFGVMARIHWQAALLYFGKRIPFFRKPIPPVEETSS